MTLLIDIDDASPSDWTVLPAIYLSGYAQAAVPRPVDLAAIESTVDANLMLSGESPRDLIFLKAVVDTSVAGTGLARRRRDDRRIPTRGRRCFPPPRLGWLR